MKSESEAVKLAREEMQLYRRVSRETAKLLIVEIEMLRLEQKSLLKALVTMESKK